MNKNINNLKSSLSFAIDMRKKYTSVLKEWQEMAISKLNAYCKNDITIEEYLSFVRAYNQVLIKYDYWLCECSHLTFEISEALKHE